MQVARITANEWAITARGFNGRFANKLLVLVDGRCVYTPSFSGVNWDTLDVPLDEIERIEVIRGPGATMWGANAVNGVINIITKPAQNTQGGRLTTGGGNQDLAAGGARYGGTLGPHASYRVFSTYSNRKSFLAQSGVSAEDDWYLAHGGFRVDWDRSGDSFTFSGDGFRGRVGRNYSLQTLTPPYTAQMADSTFPSGGDLQAQWRHRYSERSETELQVYADGYARYGDIGGDRRLTFDVDFQHRWQITSHQELQWGLEVRHSLGGGEKDFVAAFDPLSRTETLYSLFAQDEVRLVPDRLFLTVGSKFEHNVYTGLEAQPDLRLMWTPAPRHAFWVAASRAVRTPSRLDEDIRIREAVIHDPRGLVSVVTLSGNHHMRSETLLGYQAGYRTQLGQKVSLDVTLFYNRYNNLETIEPGPGQPHLVSAGYFLIPYTYSNLMDGDSPGAELAATYIPVNRWKLTGGFSALDMSLHLKSASRAGKPAHGDGVSPDYQWRVRSEVSLPRRVEWDSALYFVGRIQDQNVPAYARLDTRLGWRVSPELEFSVGGQNLMAPRHVEFYLPGEGPDARFEVQRSIFGKVTWSF